MRASCDEHSFACKSYTDSVEPECIALALYAYSLRLFILCVFRSHSLSVCMLEYRPYSCFGCDKHMKTKHDKNHINIARNIHQCIRYNAIQFYRLLWHFFRLDLRFLVPFFSQGVYLFLHAFFSFCSSGFYFSLRVLCFLFVRLFFFCKCLVLFLTLFFFSRSSALSVRLSCSGDEGNSS